MENGGEFIFRSFKFFMMVLISALFSVVFPTAFQEMERSDNFSVANPIQIEALKNYVDVQRAIVNEKNWKTKNFESTVRRVDRVVQDVDGPAQLPADPAQLVKLETAVLGQPTSAVAKAKAKSDAQVQAFFTTIRHSAHATTALFLVLSLGLSCVGAVLRRRLNRVKSMLGQNGFV